MNINLKQLLEEYKRHLLKAISHLEYSYQKVQQLNTEVAKLNLEELETWESFSSRFARTSDIFLNKYMRTYLQILDPAFKGSLLDALNESEKQGLIENAETWYRIRELRNREAHEYTEEALSLFFADVRTMTPNILNLKEKLK